MENARIEVFVDENKITDELPSTLDISPELARLMAAELIAAAEMVERRS